MAAVVRAARVTTQLPKIHVTSFWILRIEGQVFCTITHIQVVNRHLWDIVSAPLVRPDTMVSSANDIIVLKQHPLRKVLNLQMFT